MRTILIALLLGCAVGASAQAGTVAPTLEAVLTPPFYGSETRSFFGTTVAMNGIHGAASGEVTNDGPGSGAVHMLRRSGETWTVRQHITPEGGRESRFGADIALDGNVMFVSAPATAIGGIRDVGAVYVYEFNGAAWMQTSVIAAPLPAQRGLFGHALDFDGQRLIIGSPARSGPINSAGAAYIFERIGATWTLTASLTSTFQQPNNFGYNVAIGGSHAVVMEFSLGTSLNTFEFDGTAWAWTSDLNAGGGGVAEVLSPLSMDEQRLLIGSPRVFVNGQYGAVYVFEYRGGSWIRTAELADQILPGETGINYFGSSVDLDGDQIIGGSPVAGRRALVFSFDGSTWTRDAVLTTPEDFPYDYLGTAVALADGRALVGAPGASLEGAPLVGDVKAFQEGATGWTQTASLNLGPPRTGVLFGASVAMSGGRIAVGAPTGGDVGGPTGSVYVYSVTGTTATLEARVLGLYDPLFGTAVAIETDVLMVGAPGDSGKGRVFIYGRGPSGWTLVQTLNGQGGFGSSISLDGGRVLIGSPARGSAYGQAFLYERDEGEWRFSASFIPDAPGAVASFGASVALDGTRLIIGAPFVLRNTSVLGAAYVFESDGEAWERVATLTSGDNEPSGAFGTGVAISGGRALVGAPTVAGAAGGRSFLFEGIGWSRTATFGDREPGNPAGTAVALDGNRALIGAPRGGTADGRAALYAFDGSGWTQTVEIAPPATASGSRFGSAVALAGRRFAVTAPRSSPESRGFGSVSVYRDQTTVAGDEPPLAGVPRLRAPRPNPTAGTSRVVLTLTQPERVTATVYDALGRSVQTLLSDEPVAGDVALDVRGDRLAPGIYVVRVVGETFAESARLVVVR